jgi:hypothetical protein
MLKVDLTGKVLAKKLPSDPVYMPVNIRGSLNVMPTNRLAQPVLNRFLDEDMEE